MLALRTRSGRDSRRIDHDGPKMAELLLQSRMAVVPIGARSGGSEICRVKVVRGLIPGNETPGTPSNWTGHEQAVPVNRAILIEMIDDVSAAHPGLRAGGCRGAGTVPLIPIALGLAAVDGHHHGARF
jgi:hypothetical protein